MRIKKLITSLAMSEEMGLFEAIYNCRAMRRLDTREIPEKLLIKLIDAANQAPSGGNTQNARWIAVRDPTVKQRLTELNRKGVEGYMSHQPAADSGALPHQDPKRWERMFNAVLWQMEHMHEIPVLIIACLEFGAKVSPDTIRASGGSIWPGVQNLLLAARALGLGATPTTLALLDHDAFASALNLPETMAAYCMIPVGYPTGKFGPVSRRPVEEIMRFDTWK